MTNYLRTNYRITGGKINEDAIAMGVSSAPTTATALGTVEIAHGMGTAPTLIMASPYAQDTLGCYRYVTLMAVDDDYATFIVVSAPLAVASNVGTQNTASAVTSQLTVTFVWMAIR